MHARNVDLAQAEALLLQNRGLSGRLTADATISEASTVRVSTARSRSPAAVFRPTSISHSSQTSTTRAIALPSTPHCNKRPEWRLLLAAPCRRALFRKAADEHVAGTPEDAIDLRLQTPALNLGVIQGFTTAVSRGRWHARSRRPRHGLRPGSPSRGVRRDPGRRVRRAALRRRLYSGLDTRIDLEPDVVRVRRFEILDENGEQLAVAGELAVHARQIGAVNFTLDSREL